MLLESFISLSTVFKVYGKCGKVTFAVKKINLQALAVTCYSSSRVGIGMSITYSAFPEIKLNMWVYFLTNNCIFIISAKKRNSINICN